MIDSFHISCAKFLVYTPNLNFKFFKKYIFIMDLISCKKNASNLVVKIDFKVHVCVKSYLEKKK